MKVIGVLGEKAFLNGDVIEGLFSYLQSQGLGAEEAANILVVAAWRLMDVNGVEPERGLAMVTALWRSIQKHEEHGTKQ